MCTRPPASIAWTSGRGSKRSPWVTVATRPVSRGVSVTSRRWRRAGKPEALASCSGLPTGDTIRSRWSCTASHREIRVYSPSPASRVHT
eukprot:3151104-Rhodomonas_salina.1